MANPQKRVQREAERAEVLNAWSKQHEIHLHRLDQGQQWVVFGALQLIAGLGELAPLKRLVGYSLAHSGMGLSAPIIGAVTGVSARALRTTKKLEPKKLLHSIRTKPRGRGKSKLGPENAGPLAKYLVENPGSQGEHTLAFIKDTFDVSMSSSSLNRYLNRYGLGCLRDSIHTNRPLFLGPTIYGGAFLLIPAAVSLYLTAARCLSTLKSQAPRLVLSLFFKAILGIQRIFHFETLDDIGFAILTGGKQVLTRQTLGGLVRAAPQSEVQQLMRTTAPSIQKAEAQDFSIDEHAIARFTRKFDIPKGHHTIRNKHMKVEDVTFVYHQPSRRLISMVATPGGESLSAIAGELLPSLRRRCRGAELRLVLDAGAAKRYDALLELVEHRNQVTLVRVPRHPSYVKSWEQLPEEDWTPIKESGAYKGAPPKVIHVAETQMTVKGACRKRENVRTVVVREETQQEGKDRWHALWIFGEEEDKIQPAQELISEFRCRQRHEQTYRVMVHDIYIDTAPSGYDKESEPDSPEFNPNAITLYCWVAGLATNALLDLTECLPPRFHRAHPRTLRRWFLNMHADIFLGQGTLIVLLKPKRLRKLWQTLVDRMNRRAVRIPWMENRQLVLSLDTEPPQQLKQSHSRR